MTQTKRLFLIDVPLAFVGAVFVFLAAFCAPSAYAQGPILDWTVGYYVRGATAPITSTLIAVAAAQCGQVKQVGFSTVDPTRVVWDDPNDGTKDCIFVDAALVGTVIGYGDLDARMVARNLAGTSPVSNTAQFSRSDPRPPTVPTGLRVIRSPSP